MQKQKRLLCTFLCLASFATPASANTIFSSGQPLGWLGQLLEISFFGIFSPLLPGVPSIPPITQLPSSIPSAPLVTGPCSVKPIPPIDDEDAAAFEAANGTGGVVDLKGLTPATATALNRFESRVAALGGSVSVKSAYRPPAYQAHLQLVWDRHKQLESNRESGCAVIRDQVNDEFARHSLLETQRPVNRSDHTRGLAFDAALTPGLNIDRVARSAGVYRPDMFHDPVHFRLAVLPTAASPARLARLRAAAKPKAKRSAGRRVLRARR